jgi:molybdenum cofactor cytidylyltransferase
VLNLGRDAVMITLVDRPPVGAAVLASLRAAFEAAASEIWAVVPQYNGRHGHPFLAGREMIEAFLKAPVTATAREVEHQHQGHLLYVPVDDPHVAMNVNTPDDYAALLNPQPS